MNTTAVSNLSSTSCNPQSDRSDSLISLSDYLDWQAIPGSPPGSGFRAVEQKSERTLEIRLLPWLAADSDSLIEFEKQLQLTRLLAREYSPTIVSWEPSTKPPRLVIEPGTGMVLGTWLRDACLDDCIAIAIRLLKRLVRSIQGGLLHGALSVEHIRIDHDHQLAIDFFARFYEPSTSRDTPSREIDAANCHVILCQLFEKLTPKPTPLSRWSGQSRARLKSLMRRKESTGSDLETLERWSDLLAEAEPQLWAKEDHPINPIASSKQQLDQIEEHLDEAIAIADPSDKTCETNIVSINDGTPTEATYEIGVSDSQSNPSRVGYPRVGEQLGHYRLEELIGKGGMGIVFRAIDLTDQKPAAIKVLQKNGADVAQSIRRFHKEARLLKNVQNEFVTRLYDTGVEEGHHFLAMELIEGTNLKEWLKGRLPIDENCALHIIADIARALVDAHDQEVVHRDIKPENILLAHRAPESGDGPDQSELSAYQVKLSDFGIARHVQQSESMEVTRAGSMLGTPHFMSPEQCKAQSDVGPASDIYSLGITLYLMLSGELPFQADDPMKLAAAHCFDTPVAIQRRNQQVSDSVATLLMKMLSKKPEDRFSNAGQLVSEIERLIRGDSSDFEVHPKLPLATRKVWERTFKWDLQSEPSELWPYVSNTDRFNRAIGLRAVTYRTEKDPEKGLRRFGSFRLGGLMIEWEEHPFEWIEGSRMGVLRVFASGPFKWFASTVELTPRPEGGTQLVHSVKIEPRNLAGRAVSAIEAGWKGGRSLDRVYRRIDATLSQHRQDKLHDPFEDNPRISRAQSKLIEERSESLLSAGVSLETTSKLVEYLRHESPQALAQIRPLELADALEVPADEMTETCLVAASCGLLTLRWDILCPTCRVAATTESMLSEVARHTECEACDVEFQSNLANAIELVFQADSDIREVDQGTYCIGGPATSPHVVAQICLDAGERMEINLTLKTGDYLLRSTGIQRAQPIRVRTKSAPTQLDTRLSQWGSSHHTPVLREGNLILRLTNDEDVKHSIRVERTIDRESVVTAAAASAIPRFRELFPEQVLKRGLPVATEELTLLCARLSGVDELYHRVGDAEAYEKIQSALEHLDRVVVGHRGAVIKSVGEWLIASFRNSVSAAHASLEMPLRIQDDSQLDGLGLGIALHRGATLVSTQNGRLDYFGTNARRVESLARLAENTIIISDAVFTEPAVQSCIEQCGLRSKIETFAVADQQQQLAQVLFLDDAAEKIHDA